MVFDLQPLLSFLKVLVEANMGFKGSVHRLTELAGYSRKF